MFWCSYRGLYTPWTYFGCRLYHRHLRLSRLFPVNAGHKVIPIAQGEKCQSFKLMMANELLQAVPSSGTFALLPMAVRAMEKLYRLIDREMATIGAQKVMLPCLSHAQPWKDSGRWDAMGNELLKLEDRHNTSHCLSPVMLATIVPVVATSHFGGGALVAAAMMTYLSTHEEAITSIVAANSPISHKWLPVQLYQIGRKFRDEKRPKNGLLRSREFEMKDLYSFDKDVTHARQTYDAVCGAYDRIFSNLGLDYLKVEGDVGAMGGLMSHEYHLKAQAGEDTLYVCQSCSEAVNQEMLGEDADTERQCRSCGSVMDQVAGIEVAHAFLLGTKYSETFKATFKDADGKVRPLEMGCFGIGVSRLLAAAVEVLSSPGHIRWPGLLAPYQICIIPQKKGYRFEETFRMAEELQGRLIEGANLRGEVVLDDRIQLSIGRRLASASANGFPWAVILGNKALEASGEVELVDVYSGESTFLSLDQLQARSRDIETVSVL